MAQPPSSAADMVQYGGRLSGTQFTLVTFTAGDGVPDPPVNCCHPTAATDKFLQYLEHAE